MNVPQSNQSSMVKVVVGQGGGVSVARKQGVVRVDTIEVTHGTWKHVSWCGMA